MDKVFKLTSQILLASLLVSCSSDLESDFQDQVSLNDIQMIGSHNSYKQPINDKVLEVIAQHDDIAAAKINYSHPSLKEQLRIGIRHFEIDIVKDPDGGRFSQPLGEQLTKQTLLSSSEIDLLNQPGFKVMHLPDLDFKSHCILFQSCLDELLEFSINNQQHMPIVVLMNLKESQSKFIEGTQVLSFEKIDYAEIDDVLKNTFGSKLITPDDIKGQFQSLEQAVLIKGWPLLRDVRGKFLFILDGNKNQREAYRLNHASLKNRAMFASYEQGEPEAALMVRNDPIKLQAQIKALVEKGYMVRTRADSGAGTLSKSKNVEKRTQHAFTSGAQIISTDFYQGAPQVLPSNFVVSFKQGMLYRCNKKVRKVGC